MSIRVPAISNKEITYDQALGCKPGTMFIFVDKKGIIHELEKRNDTITYFNTRKKFDKSRIGDEPDLIITEYINNNELID